MAVAVLPRHNLGLRGMHRLGLGDTSGNPGAGVQIVQGAAGPYIADANGNTVYTQAEVAANPGLLTQVTANSGCPSGSQPTWTMAGSVCQYPGNPNCLDPTGVCGSFAQPGQSQANPGNADLGWVLGTNGWFWNGPGTPTTPSPGAINELTTTAIPTFAQTPTNSPAVTTSQQTPTMPTNPAGSPQQNTPAPPPTQITPANVYATVDNETTCIAFGGDWSGLPNAGYCMAPASLPLPPGQNITSNMINTTNPDQSGGGNGAMVNLPNTSNSGGGIQPLPTTTVSCTGGFMDLFTAGCPNPLTTGEILIGVGVLAIIGFMMMGSGGGGYHR
jgi:hypothetical protein